MINKIIKILMRRDDLTEDEATDIYNEAKEAIDDILANNENGDYIGAYNEIEEILASDLGLEIDYIMDFIF